MANDYTNLTLTHVSLAKVTAAAERLSMEGAVAAAGAAVVVFLPFDAYLGAESSAARLVRALKCDGLLVTNVRDSALFLSVFKSGARQGDWMCPEALQPRLEVICGSAFDSVPDELQTMNPGGMSRVHRSLATLSGTADDKALGRILGGKYAVEYERHRVLARALGLPDDIVIHSYEDIVDGDLPDTDEPPIIIGDS